MKNIVLTATVFIWQFCFSQEDIENLYDKESFTKLPSGIIKSEIAYFNITAELLKTKTDSIPKIKVNEVTLTLCTDSSAHFQKPKKSGLYIDVYSSKFDTTGHKLTYNNDTPPILILIDNKPIWGTDGNIPRKKLKKVDFISHNHLRVNFPDSALVGIYEPNLCNKVQLLKPELSSSCQVFISEDKRRIYIYMNNGDGAGGYEVTWIFDNARYQRRVIDHGF